MATVSTKPSNNTKPEIRLGHYINVCAIGEQPSGFSLSSLKALGSAELERVLSRNDLDDQATIGQVPTLQLDKPSYLITALGNRLE